MAVLTAAFFVCLFWEFGERVGGVGLLGCFFFFF